MEAAAGGAFHKRVRGAKRNFPKPIEMVEVEVARGRNNNEDLKLPFKDKVGKNWKVNFLF